MKISILCSSSEHPIYPHLEQWAAKCAVDHDVSLVNSSKDLGRGDILFLISCNELIDSDVRNRFGHSLVIHASSVPKGRGWSPHIWQIIEGKNVIPVSLLEAEDEVDSGAIWSEKKIHLSGCELFDEINLKLFQVTTELMDFAVENIATVCPRPQENSEPTYYRKRTAEDSRLDPNKSIVEQFELLRVADPDRFPCFFEHRGERFDVVLRKRKL
jgi:methionyl-tRNA formyltransferase